MITREKLEELRKDRKIYQYMLPGLPIYDECLDTIDALLKVREAAVKACENCLCLCEKPSIYCDLENLGKILAATEPGGVKS